MMPMTIGNDFEYFDITTGGNTVRHLIKDSEAREDISDLKSALVQRTDVLNTLFNANTVYTSTTLGKWWKNENGVATLADIGNQYYASNPIDVTPGMVLSVTGKLSDTHLARLWYVTDNSYNILASSDDTYGLETYTGYLVVPNSGAKLLITGNPGVNPAVSLLVPKTDLPLQFRGFMDALGYTAFAQCLKDGWYSFGTAYAASVTDKPTGFSTAGTLITLTKVYADGGFKAQFLFNDPGTIYMRSLKNDNTVLTDWHIIIDANAMSTLQTAIGDIDALQRQVGNVPTGETVEGQITDLTSVISVLDREVDAIESYLEPVPVTLSMTQGYYWNVEESTAVYTSVSSTWSASSAIPVKSGEVYHVRGKQYTTHKTRVWVVTDDDYNILATANDDYSDGAITTDEIFAIPSGGTKLLVTSTINPTLNLLKLDDFRFRGYMETLGKTAFSDCVEDGWYSFGTSYSASITDKPEGLSTAGSMLNLSRTFANGGEFKSQFVYVDAGTLWARTLKNDNTVLTDWHKIVDPAEIVAIQNALAPMQSALTAAQNDINVLSGICISTESLETDYESGGISGNEGNYYRDTNNARIHTKQDAMPKVATGDKITIGGDFEGKIFAGSTQNYTFATIISGANWISGEITISSTYNGKYIGLLLRDKNHTLDDISSLVDDVPDNVTVLRVETIAQDVSSIKSTLDASKTAGLKNKVVAVIGDSISTHGDNNNAPEIIVQSEDVGVELSAYLTYFDVQAGLSLGGHTFTSDEIGTEVTFTPVAGDVGKRIGRPYNYNPADLKVWWQYLEEEFGCTVIPVCWSSSAITRVRDSGSGMETSCAWHPAQIRKCGIRTPGTMQRTAPDIVIIARGGNDFHHSPYARLTANYFDNPVWTYPVNDTVETNQFGFLEGYAKVVQGLRQAYPLAQIIFCTCPMIRPSDIDSDQFVVNNGINSLNQFNKATREAADFFGCNVISFDKDGVTFENAYSGGFVTDSATNPVHPGALGHKVMGARAIADIRATYNPID